MSGDLNMGRDKIRGPRCSPTERRRLRRRRKKIRRSVATKVCVDSRKPLVMLWVEENGSIGRNNCEWSFGNGSSGDDHGLVCHTMMVTGRILQMGLSWRCSGCTLDRVRVNIVVMGSSSLNTALSRMRVHIPTVHKMILITLYQAPPTAVLSLLLKAS